MDKLTKESQEHGEIFESLTFFKKSLEVFANSETSDFIEKFQKFIDEYLVEHFEFEENELFPTILKGGTPKEKHLIRELQLEHDQILGKVDQFKNLISSCGYQPIGVQIKEIIRYSREIIKMVLQHARKEDKELFPMLRKYEINLK